MIDARGYLCPTPVVMVMKEVKAKAPETVEVLVDNQCSVENVTRYGQGQGYQVTVTAEGGDFRLKLVK